jgi:hypothetical protein
MRVFLVCIVLLTGSLLAFLAADCGQVFDAFADPAAAKREVRRKTAEAELADCRQLFGHLPEGEWPPWVRGRAKRARQALEELGK